MRARILWEVLQIGNLIASPQVEEEDAGDGYVCGAMTYAWWYRPLVWLGFWLARPKDESAMERALRRGMR